MVLSTTIRVCNTGSRAGDEVVFMFHNASRVRLTWINLFLVCNFNGCRHSRCLLVHTRRCVPSAAGGLRMVGLLLRWVLLRWVLRWMLHEYRLQHRGRFVLAAAVAVSCREDNAWPLHQLGAERGGESERARER